MAMVSVIVGLTVKTIPEAPEVLKDGGRLTVENPVKFIVLVPVVAVAVALMYKAPVAVNPVAAI